MLGLCAPIPGSCTEGHHHHQCSSRCACAGRRRVYYRRFRSSASLKPPRERPRSRSPSTPNWCVFGRGSFSFFFFVCVLSSRRSPPLRLLLLLLTTFDDDAFARTPACIHSFIHSFNSIHFTSLHFTRTTESGCCSHRHGWRRGYLDVNARRPVRRDDGCRRYHRIGAGETRFTRPRIRGHDQRVHVHWTAL